MRQHEKYQTICDYTLTISYDMSVTHDIKRCETPMQKLEEISSYFLYTKSSALAGLFVFYRAVQFVKNPAVLFTFCRFYGIIQLIDKLEFDEENHE